METSSDPDKSRAGTEHDVRAFTVGSDDAGARLDVFLARSLEISRAQSRRLLARGAVSLDGRVLVEKDKGLALAAGGRIDVESFRRPSEQAPLPEPEGGAPPLSVLAEGEGWLVVDKPPGMPVHPLNEGETGTVLNAVVKLHPEIVGVGEGGLRCGVVHRLDVWTSGALVIATREDVWQRLRSAFAEHHVEKRYLALVEGELDTGPEGVLELDLGLVMARHRPAKVRVVRPDEPESPAVRPVSQTVRLVESYGAAPAVGLRGEACMVEVRPRTGFLHQIRVTLAHLGHPLIGDRTYGGKRRDDRADWAAACGATRHMLHAAEVEVDEVHAVAPLAPDFEACRAKLREIGEALTLDADESEAEEQPE
ncbi:MAG: RluA family pseudouridine synthase [Actinomycetota bacterium]|nr:RluA family pseudouridine synthase [Actinomycetota bacterium]